MAPVITRLSKILVRPKNIPQINYLRMMSGSAAVGTPGEGAGKGGGAGGIYMINTFSVTFLNLKLSHSRRHIFTVL